MYQIIWIVFGCQELTILSQIPFKQFHLQRTMGDLLLLHREQPLPILAQTMHLQIHLESLAQ